MPVARPSRRAATRRNAVIDSDDEEDQIANTTRHAEDDEEEFEPEAPQSPKRQRRSTRQSSIGVSQPAPTRGRGRPRKSVAPDVSVTEDSPVAESEAVSEADVTIKADPETPKKKRKISAPHITVATPASNVLPTPQSAIPSDFTTVTATPLSDITTASVNTRLVDETPVTVKPARNMTAMMDNPIDIRFKSRNMTTIVEPEAPKPRIVLTYLILNNFKSYAGRQEVGPFHATFSSVVGPNGSGKSNVIDSLLFVFGFRASKMRQGKISALIHNSAQYPNLEFCEVAVHFHEVMDQVRALFVCICRLITDCS